MKSGALPGYREIMAAKKTLGLPDHASMQEIKANFRSLISRWHPDTCRGDSRKCEEMTKKILDAQKIIMAYCAQYTYAFTEQEIKKYLSDDEWWEARFGNDPVWGKGTASKDDR
jgi:DnaJ-class molecular chaperone